MIYNALVPVKSLTTAKSRLNPFLSPKEREALVLDMLCHVLTILRSDERFERVYVVSPDSRVLKQAADWGAFPLVEEHHEHNAALQAAASRILHDEYRGYTQALLTISADLPLLCASDIHAMLKQSSQHQIVLAASREGSGTNAILMNPPLVLPYLFGVGSLQRYLLAAQQDHLSVTTCRSMGLALDVDTLEDLHELQFVSCEAL